ncbi:small conductance mechanosensitive channel [Conyzicola lurida]|uniref:Small conductance mechanosensitive channel n=1 Tax=Conyzicola lurida TaxID=1172621 RepID=A0A841AK64_9MICO|nr:small conductance mechanosensitive channel [Conyzicola lurida]
MAAVVDPETPSFDWSAFWTMLADFYNATPPLQVVVIIVFAILLRLALQLVINRVVDRIVLGVKKKQNVDDTQALFASPLAAVRVVQRTRTLGSVLNNVVTAVVVSVAVLASINALFPGVTGAFSLITAALGAGLGFGAQNIVKDVLSGLFMVAEDQVGVGDVVDLGPATGVVEDVGIRITKVRDVNGTLWFVRNGEILRVGNMSQGWSRVIIDLAVPYDADVEAVQAKMLETGTALATEPKWRSRVLEKPEIWGIESISGEAIVVRIVVKTRSAAKDDVARELRSRLKRALDEMDVKMPALNSITLSGFEGATSVKGARPPRTKPIEVQAAEKTTPARTTPQDDPRGFTPGTKPTKPRKPTA